MRTVWHAWHRFDLHGQQHHHFVAGTVVLQVCDHGRWSRVGITGHVDRRTGYGLVDINVLYHCLDRCAAVLDGSTQQFSAPTPCKDQHEDPCGKQ